MDVEALANKIGMCYGDGKVDLGAPIFAFTPKELAEFARRLASAQQQGDEPIACDVKVAPGTTFRAGVPLSVVMTGIRQRATWEGRPIKFPRREQCCICGNRFDAREQSEGGGPDGAQLTDGRWTCSPDCWERASAQQAPAATAPDACVPCKCADCGSQNLGCYNSARQLMVCNDCGQIMETALARSLSQSQQAPAELTGAKVMGARGASEGVGE